MNRTQLTLTADEREAYERDGFFARRAVLPEAELVALRAAAERVVTLAEANREKPDERYAIDGNVYLEADGSTIQLEHSPGSDTLRVIEPFHHLDPLLDSLMDDPRLVEPIRGILGSPRVSLFTDKMNLKRPREGSGFRWHQDSPYWHHFCDHLERLPNVMVALDDADEGNGCFRVVRGSHKQGCLPGLQGEGKLEPLFTDPACFDLSEQVPVVVPAGSLVFFCAHTVHGSEPNRSERPRRALVITYQPGGHPMFKHPGEREVDASAAV